MELQQRLEDSGLAGLAVPIWAAVTALRAQGAVSGAALNAKFATEDGAFEMAFGSLERFYSGLEGLIGPPRFYKGSLLKSMEREHCCEPDSTVPFETTNGVKGATSEREWEFVAEPRMFGDHAGRYVEREGPHSPSHRRSPCCIHMLQDRLKRVNVQLASRQQSLLVLEEVLGGRLYTGSLEQMSSTLMTLPLLDLIPGLDLIGHLVMTT